MASPADCKCGLRVGGLSLQIFRPLEEQLQNDQNSVCLFTKKKEQSQRAGDTKRNKASKERNIAVIPVSLEMTGIMELAHFECAPNQGHETMDDA